MLTELTSIPSICIDRIDGFIAGAKAMIREMPNPSGNDPMAIELEFRKSGNCHIWLVHGSWTEIDGQLGVEFPPLPWE